MVYWKKMGLFGPDGGISDENEGFRGPFDGRGAGMRAGRRGCRNPPAGGGIQSVSAAEITLLSNGDSVYVGGVALTGSTESPAYATTDTSGNVITKGATAANYNIKWDGSTLTLKDAYITKGVSTPDYSSPVEGAAIGVFSTIGNAELTIQLAGSNTVDASKASKGVHVYSSSGTATLNITGSGSLNASGFQSGIQVQSNSNNATLTIQGAVVGATVSSASGDGVVVQAGGSSNASLSVDGGSLIATGKSDYGAGIRYTFGSSSSGSGTPSLTVSGNAMVKASGGEGGIRDNSSADIQIGDGNNSSGGIVFDNGTGTVYGDVTLQDNLTVGEGESLTIPDGASLNANGKLTVDGGTITGNVSGGVTYKVTGVSLDKDSLTLEAGKSGTLTAAITPDNATNKNVEWESSNTAVATVENGTVTAEGEGTATITVTTADGGLTDTCTVTVTAVPEPEPEPEPEPTPEPEPEPEPEEPEEAYIPSTPIPDGFHEYSLGTMLYVDGKRVKGLYESEGATYFFNEQGFMQTGWVEFAEGWRYFSEDGRMATGWLQIGNAWYYLAPETGIMFDDGLHTIGKSTYYFYDWGGMASDWWYEDEAGDWYFFGGSGAMKAAQWLEWKGDWYYLTESGRMAVDTEIGGYYVNASGVWAG